MKLIFFPHAEERIKERGIDKSLLKQAISEPDQIIKEKSRTIFHRRYINNKNKKEYLLRVFVERQEGKKYVVSAYRTSKIDKYWRGRDEDKL